MDPDLIGIPRSAASVIKWSMFAWFCGAAALPQKLRIWNSTRPCAAWEICWKYLRPSDVMVPSGVRSTSSTPCQSRTTFTTPWSPRLMLGCGFGRGAGLEGCLEDADPLGALEAAPCAVAGLWTCRPSRAAWSTSCCHALVRSDAVASRQACCLSWTALSSAATWDARLRSTDSFRGTSLCGGLAKLSGGADGDGLGGELGKSSGTSVP